MVELLVSSMFDSGYYASIRVVDLGSNALLVERHAEPDSGGVPRWFIRLIGLEPAGGDAIVSRGWQQAARVEVVSHPMFALAKLWRSALGSLAWLLACGVVSALLGALLLRRQLRCNHLPQFVHRLHRADHDLEVLDLARVVPADDVDAVDLDAIEHQRELEAQAEGPAATRPGDVATHAPFAGLKALLARGKR